MGYPDASFLVPFLKLLMGFRSYDPFCISRQGVEGPGGTGLALPVILIMSVGTTQIPFLMCTLEIPQKLQYKFLLLTFCLLTLLLSFSLNCNLIIYFWFCSFSQSYEYFNNINSTSLSFSELYDLFTSMLLLAKHI